MGLLLGLSTRHPVLLIVEDLQWVDPSTLECLELLIARAPTGRLLAVLTARPDVRALRVSRTHVTPLTLTRLRPAQIEQVIAGVAGGKALPAAVVQHVATKTDGVPLFIEELTKMVLESGLVRLVDGRYELTGPLPPLAIPATLQDSLMARLDQLASVKAVAQIGAAIGRTFSYRLLRAVSELDEATLRRELGKLVDAELLYQRGAWPETTYIFKHALIQDAAYYQCRGEPRPVLECSNAALGIAREHGLPFWTTAATMMRGWALAKEGDPGQGIELMRWAVEDKRVQRSELVAPYYQSMLADVLIDGGDHGQALALLEEAIEIGQRTGERWWEAEEH